MSRVSTLQPLVRQWISLTAVSRSPFPLQSNYQYLPRRMASAIKKKKYTGPTTNPEIFSQRVVLTDGSTITLRTTSPKSQLKLTKDTRNHPLWNPTLGNLMSDDVDHLQRFSKFSDLEGIETLSDSVSADAEADLQELKRYADEILKKNQESKTKN